MSHVRPNGARWAMVGSAVCFAVVERLGRYLPSTYSPIQVVWSRYGVHLAALLLVAAWSRRNPLKTARPVRQIGRSLLMLGMPATFVVAIQSAPPANVWSLFWIAPLGVVAAAPGLAGGDVGRIGAGSWVAAIAAYAGVVLGLRPTMAWSKTALLATIGMALCFGLYLLLTRTLRAESTISRLWYTAFGVFVALTPLVRREYVQPSAGEAIVLVGIGVIGLACLWLLDMAVDGLPVAEVAPLLYVVPVTATVLTAALSGWPGRSAVAGATLACVALWAWIRLRPPVSTPARSH